MKFDDDIKNRFIKMFLSRYIDAATLHAVARELGIPKERISSFCKELGFKYALNMVLPEVYDDMSDVKLLRRFYRLAKNEADGLRREVHSLKKKVNYRDKQLADSKLKLDNILKKYSELNVQKACVECMDDLDALPMPWYLKLFGGKYYLARVKDYIKSEVYC